MRQQLRLLATAPPGFACRARRCLLTAADSQENSRTELEGPVRAARSAAWQRRGGRPGESRSILTEFEYGQDGACKRLLPKPGPGGFARGTFIGWRRSDRYGPERSLSVHDLYEMKSVLGQGGFGIVHAARHRRTGESVAIKSVAKDKVTDRETLKLEVEFLKVADHPNLIRYYETIEDSEHLHLIMELCSGGALSAHIKKAHENHGPGIDESDLARIMQQLLRSVAYCHTHSIVHRDLKPQNFLFGCGSPQKGSFVPVACSGTADAPLKLVDFGVSGVVRTDRPEKRWLTRRAGTDGYMAPEVLEGQLYGPNADLFSLGAVLHTMIVGKPPRWECETRSYTFPGKIRWRMLSAEGQSFLERLLHADPAMRPTAQEALRDPWFQAEGYFSSHDVAKFQDDCVASFRQWALRSKLQRSIMYSMVAFAPLHNHSMEQSRVAFLAASKDASGCVTREDFAKVFRGRQSGLAIDVDGLFSTVNSSQSGQISYSEWLAAGAPQAWYDHPEYMRRAFDTLDANRRGYIDATDLCRVLPGVFEAQEIDEEIRYLTESGNGLLFFEDFCALSRHSLASEGVVDELGLFR